VKRLRSHPTFLNARAALAALSGNCDQGDGKLRRVEKARVDDDNEELIARVSEKLGVTVEDFMSANAYALDLRRRFDAHRLVKVKNAKNRREKWKRELAANEAHYIAMTAEEAAAALGVSRPTLRAHWRSLERGRWGRWPAQEVQVARRPWKQELAANEAHYIAMTAEEAAAALGVSTSTLSRHWRSLERGRWPARQVQAARRPWKQEFTANEAHYIAMTAEEAAAALGVSRPTLRDHWHSLERGRWPRGRWPRRQVH